MTGALLRPPPSSPLVTSAVFSVLKGLFLGFSFLLVWLLKFHIWGKAHGVCLSLAPSTSLQMARVHCFWWLSNSPLCVHIHLYCSAHSSAVAENAAINVGVHVSFQAGVLYRMFIYFGMRNIFICIILTTRNVNDSLLCLNTKKPSVISIKNKNANVKRRGHWDTGDKELINDFSELWQEAARRWADRAEKNTKSIWKKKGKSVWPGCPHWVMRTVTKFFPTRPRRQKRC